MDFKKIALIFLFLILLNVVIAEEETISAQEQNQIINENIISDETNETNETEVIPEPVKEVKEIIFKNFIPREFKLGDAQFSIQIQNNKNETINNILAFVSGKGFSTYEVTPVESLESEEKGYILVNGNFKESGIINLTIKINKEIFYQEVNILGESQEDIKKSEELAKQQEEKKIALSVMSSELEILKQNYSNLETQLEEKEKEGYDIKNVNLDELKKYLRETQASILGEHLEGAKINLDLATEEYDAEEKKLETLEKLPFMKRFKEHVIVFSSIAGAIITFFALYELLKKKGKEAVTTIGSIKPKAEDKENKEEPKVQQQEINKEAENINKANNQEEEGKEAEEETEEQEKKSEKKDKGKRGKKKRKNK